MFQEQTPYLAYADAGLPWLDQYPAHWRTRRFKEVLRAIDSRSTTGEEELLTVSSANGVVPRESQSVTMFRAASYVGHKLASPGDLVINSLWAWGRGLGVSSHFGIVSTAYGVYRPTVPDLLDADFLHLYVRSEPYNWELRERSRGIWISRLQLTDDRFLASPFVAPPIDEQRAIVTYLAHAHQRINQTIATKRRLLALREEESQVMIADLLTGGVHSAIRSDGLRAIPSSWRYESAGRICTISTGVEDSGNADPDGAYPFFVRGREVLRSNDYLFDAEAVMTPGDGQGGTGKVFHYFDGKFQAHQRVYVLKDFDEVLGRYFFWYMSTFFREHALSKSNTVTMESLRRPMIASFPVALPPIDEQANIVVRVESLRAQVDQLVRVAKREIALLEEFRTRLTADVVTGQVDVRAIAATLPALDLRAALASAEYVEDVDGDANDDGVEDE